MRRHKCLACNKRTITWQFAICAECEKEFGSSSSDWPEWLRFLWNDTQRERRDDKKHNQWEVDVDFNDLREVSSGKRPRQNASE